MAINLGSNSIEDVKLGNLQVEKIYLEDEVVWQKTSPVSVNALKFSSTGSQTLGIDTTKLGTITPVFEYSTDGETWTSWTVLDTLSFGNGTDLYIRGMNTFLSKGGINYTNFVFSTASPVECSGNIMHLFDYTQDLTAIPDESGQSRGVKYMFANCTQLITAPDLPATTLVIYAYSNMFEGCTSLEIPPFLPATNTTTSNYAYYNMFKNCTSLNTLPSLNHLVTPSAGICVYMFDGCSNIKMSGVQDEEYVNEYTFGFLPDGSSCQGMFANTGGSMTGLSSYPITIYTSNNIRLS